MLHPDTELRYLQSEKRYGIFATKSIPKGTATWALDQIDRILLDAETKELILTYGPNINKHIFRSKGLNVFSWDNARYMSNSCRPNCLGTPYGFEVAARKINRGMELTRDCNAALHDESGSSCSCRETICLMYMGGSDAKKKKALMDALQDFHSVSQPLAPLLNAAGLDRPIDIVSSEGYRDSQRRRL